MRGRPARRPGCGPDAPVATGPSVPLAWIGRRRHPTGMRSLRPALLSVLLARHAGPAARPGGPGPAARADRAGRSDREQSRRSSPPVRGSDLLTDVTGYFVAGGGGATFTPVDARSACWTRAPATASRTRSRPAYRESCRSPAVARAGDGQGGDDQRHGDRPDVARATSRSGPTMSATPTTSTLNFPTGDTRANNATVALDGIRTTGARLQGRRGLTGPSHRRRHRLLRPGRRQRPTPPCRRPGSSTPGSGTGCRRSASERRAAVVPRSPTRGGVPLRRDCRRAST